MRNIRMILRRPVRPAGMGQKNIDQVRIRNRRYKIKRFLAQPKNIDVKQNGRVLRRMVVEEKQSIKVLDVEENINCLKLNIYVGSLL